MYYDGCLWKKRNFLKLQVFIFIILTIAPLLVTCYGLKGTNFFPQFLNFMGLSENFVQWRVYHEIQSPFFSEYARKKIYAVTTRQRSSGKVMFSVLSVSQTVCSQGPNVITHCHVQPCLLGNHDPDPDTSAAPYPHGTPSRSKPPCTYAFIWKFSVSLRLKGLLFYPAYSERFYSRWFFFCLRRRWNRRSWGRWPYSDTCRKYRSAWGRSCAPLCGTKKKKVLFLPSKACLQASSMKSKDAKPRETDVINLNFDKFPESYCYDYNSQEWIWLFVSSFFSKVDRKITFFLHFSTRIHIEFM